MVAILTNSPVGKTSFCDMKLVVPPGVTFNGMLELRFPLYSVFVTASVEYEEPFPRKGGKCKGSVGGKFPEDSLVFDATVYDVL